MDLAAILALVTKGISLVEVAIKVGAAVPDVLALIGKVKSWVDGSAVPTPADSADLDALEAKYLAKLNDTSRDDPAEVSQGGE